jgi:hypothetical protein
MAGSMCAFLGFEVFHTGTPQLSHEGLRGSVSYEDHWIQL